jgi:hypothetical protein
VRFVPAALIAGLLLAGGACSGSSETNQTASLIHRLLQAGSKTQSSQLESFVGKLPPGLPAKPPQYPDAKVIVSSRQPASTGDAQPTPDKSGNIAQPMLYLIVLDTADTRDKVYSYYQSALEKDPWQIASTFSTEDLDTLQFSDISDADISGVVSIARGGQDNRTSVLISLQDAGAFRRELPPFKLQPSLPVPKQFPSDIPLYEGATVTGSAFVRAPANESFLVTFLTKDSKEKVTDFYRSAFQRLGWTVQPGAPLGVQQRFNFQDATGDVQGDLLADAFARDSSYTEVRIQVRQNPSRQPAKTTTTPQQTAAATPQPTALPTPQPT